MKIEGRYGIGTVREMSHYIVSDLHIKECDVSIYTEFQADLSLKELAEGGFCSGWYGIKKVNTGFDTCGTDLISDYYGGRCASYGFIDDDDTKECAAETVRRMLMETLNMTEKCTEDDVLLWDFEPEREK